ncbi:Tripeptidyl-peptidase II protein [Dioscorea alata]|uniref:Tripeptidyl-peptidase II protein n=1 Tax=Dioscorea alata TaxID=55571 RepID=A0ACB7WA05_DIOAL|nr:Tripeptidyl-peptidase II protein [Dioscorea alata]
MSANITDTPRDTEGHGSHTLSTAAGAFVPGASYYGYANGTAKGGSSRARVATYKVCWPSDEGGCMDADILAAFDAAIHDGVDVISMSVGGPPLDYYQDSIAIGSFHAVKKGITVACSGGNDGPSLGTVSNVAPWIFTVGASTLDRYYPSYLVYNGKFVKGMTFSKNLPRPRPYPMINSVNAKAKNATEHAANLCMVNSLDPEKVKGKIVVCLRGKSERMLKGIVVQKAGGAGMIIANDEGNADDIEGDAHFIPAINIGYSDGLDLYSYLNSSKSPKGYILCGRTKFGKRPSPTMAPFSSLGPNVINKEILKLCS